MHIYIVNDNINNNNNDNDNNNNSHDNAPRGSSYYYY